MDFEEKIERVGFHYGIPREYILWHMDLEELFRYNNKVFFFLLEQQGKKPKKPTTEQDREYQEEYKAMMKKRYEKA